MSALLGLAAMLKVRMGKIMVSMPNSHEL
jgi:hypothetical protein